jgi:rhodanese-related sulfurtransferase
MPRIRPRDQSHQSALSAVDYFMAKLQYESTPGALHALLQEKDSLIVLDVRRREAFEREHIAGAVNIPLDELPKRYEELPKEKTIVTYGADLTCPKAAKAALELAHRGYKVQELLGGIETWRRFEFPIESSPQGRA